MMGWGLPQVRFFVVLACGILVGPPAGGALDDGLDAPGDGEADQGDGLAVSQSRVLRARVTMASPSSVEG